MHGTLINNGQLRMLVEAKLIIFNPSFEAEEMQIAQYPLYPGAIMKKLAPRKYRTEHNFDDDEPYTIQPNKYVLVDIREQILLPEGIVGRFIAASGLIELGLGLTAGKIEYPFCHRGEKIRFGLKNQTDEPVVLSPRERIAYIQFFDLRGLNNFDTELTKRDRELFLGRRSDQSVVTKN